MSEDEGIICKNEENGNKKVVAGFLDRLVSHLADGKISGMVLTHWVEYPDFIDTDNEYIRVFLLTHQYYIDSPSLLMKILQRCQNFLPNNPYNSLRYYIEAPPNCTEDQQQQFKMAKSVVQLRTINLLKRWLEHQRSGPKLFQLSLWLIWLLDFEEMKVKQMFEKFLIKLAAGGLSEKTYSENLQKTLQSSTDQLSPRVQLGIVTLGLICFYFQIIEKAPKPLLPSNLMPRLIRFLDLNPLEVARQVWIDDIIVFPYLIYQDDSNGFQIV